SGPRARRRRHPRPGRQRGGLLAGARDLALDGRRRGLSLDLRRRHHPRHDAPDRGDGVPGLACAPLSSRAPGAGALRRPRLDRLRSRVRLRPDLTGAAVGILDTIGRTRLLQLRHIVPNESARILVKLEYENPTGSMKDRMALAMVEAAQADGRLGSSGSVVEYTGGSTGVSLAFVCAVKRIPLQIVT